MRISTSMVYDLAGTSVQSQQAGIYKSNQQISSGKRLSSPSDDPLAAARAIEIGQSQAVSEQLTVNADYATSSLDAQQSALGSIADLLSQIRALGVQAGDAALSQPDKIVLATSLQSKYNELLGLANTQDNGKYLFSGFRGDTQPFSEVTPGVVTYNGDGGQRLIQVTPSRQVPVSASGLEIFQRIKNGNGTFSVTADPNVTGAINVGTGVASPGVLLNPTAWNTATIPNDTNAPYSVANPGAGGFKAEFVQDTSVQPPVTTYDIVAISNGTKVHGVTYNAGDSLLTGAASSITASSGGGPRLPRTYTDGATISLKFVAGDSNPDTNWDLGAELSVTGQPSSTSTTSTVTTPDSFTIRSSTNNQDLFSTVHKLIAALQSGSSTTIGNTVSTALQDLTLGEESIASALTTSGTISKEVDSHKSVNQDLIVQYKTQIANLTDLDYATALTDLTMKQTVLQAAQKSFITSQGLSLFDYIK